MSRPRPSLPAIVASLVTERSLPRRRRVLRAVSLAWPVVTLPLTTWFLFENRRIHRGYGLTWWKVTRLAYRMYRTTLAVPTGTSYRAQLAMLAKLAEIPPDVEGVVVECGCFQGGSTANLSLVCAAVGRDLVVYDSFAGLPRGDANDRIATEGGVGYLRGELDRVRDVVARHGDVSRCTFRKGWFADTLPHHTEPVVLAFLDVDLQSSIHDCLVGLWPHLVEQGYVFTDDFPILDLCAVFYSEEFWRREFDRTPPGLVGAGTGLAMGQYWVGPFANIGGNGAYPLQTPASTAYTRKDFSGYWGYVPAAAEGRP